MLGWRRAWPSDERRRPGVGRTVAVACLTVIGVLSGCTEPSTDQLRPLDGASAARTPARSPSRPAPSTSTTTDPGGGATTSDDALRTDTGAGAGTGTDTADDPTRIVDEVLARYDRTLTALLRDPGAVMRTDDPVLTAWRATIGPGAILADDIRNLAAERLGAGQIVEPPRGQDRSYLHRVVSIDDSGSRGPEPTERISFSWCGWSPGIVRDAKTGAVVDDGVGHATGTGTVRRFGTTWLLDSLDESTIDVLAAGSPDPCPRGAR